MFNYKEFRVYFKHFRDQEGEVPYPYTESPNSDIRYKGKTECFITKNDEDISMGEAYCSVHDNFSRVVGRFISFTRAVSSLDKEDRIILWEEYKRLGGLL